MAMRAPCQTPLPSNVLRGHLELAKLIDDCAVVESNEENNDENDEKNDGNDKNNEKNDENTDENDENIDENDDDNVEKESSFIDNDEVDHSTFKHSLTILTYTELQRLSSLCGLETSEFGN